MSKESRRIVKEAFYIATTGRPGPVLIDLPKDVTTHKTEFVWPDTVKMRSYKPVYEGNRYMISAGCPYDRKGQKAGDRRGGRGDRSGRQRN